MAAQAKVNTQVILRKVTPAADHLAKLHQVARSRPHTRVQSQPIAFDALQLKTDPMVFRPTLGTQNHRLAFQILNHSLEPAVVEKVAYGHSTAYLRNLNRDSCQ